MEAVPTFLIPSVAPNFAHYNGDEVFPCPGTPWRYAQAVFKSWPPFILQECTVILAIDHCTKWHVMVQQSLFLLKNMTCMTSEPPDCTVQYSSTIMLRYTIQHSVVSAEINASMTCQPLKCERGDELPSFLRRRWVLARRTCIALWPSLSMCGIHFSQTLHFPKLMVRIL